VTRSVAPPEWIATVEARAVAPPESFITVEAGA
jgi:hypothetical protein